jgi:hypothetical protein
MHWMAFSIPFRATAAETTLTLTDVTDLNPYQGLVLDGLSVTPADGGNPPVVTPLGSPDAGPATPTGLAGAAVTDFGLIPGTTYTYRVRATKNVAASDWSNEVTGTALTGL